MTAPRSTNSEDASSSAERSPSGDAGESTFPEPNPVAAPAQEMPQQQQQPVAHGARTHIRLPRPGGRVEAPEHRSLPAEDGSSASLSGIAPSLPPDVRTPLVAPLKPRSSIPVLSPGERIDDFEILTVLGAGAFGVVYLALQLSLDREVALKVTANQGHEGRTMARLEHDHIVQVFSETVVGGLRLLCMQYVAGTPLDTIIRTLRDRCGDQWNGAEFLRVIDELNPLAPTFDPASLRDRERMEDADRIEAICLIGARLAEALDYAHRQGVLHRDIKPANALVSQYGRPALVDFNLAFMPLDLARADSEVFGGTLAYMAPEHLDAFNPANPTTPAAVDARSDQFSLGVLIFELAAGELPFRPLSTVSDRVGGLSRMAEERRSQTPRLSRSELGAPKVLEQTLQRCLQPDPGQRFDSAGALAAALDGCREIRASERLGDELRLPRGFAHRRPWVMMCIVGLIPHLVGSAVNIPYNLLRIVRTDQVDAFFRLANWYNLAIYPICIYLCYRIVKPVYRRWKALERGEPLTGEEVDAARRQVVTFPGWAAVVAAIGWFPGFLWFPLGLHFLGGGIDGPAAGHFLISIGISALIAMTYSFLGVQTVVVCCLYPRFWSIVRRFGPTARRELHNVPRRLTIFQLLAGAIPLIAAVLMVFVGPDEFRDSGYAGFRLLVTALIGVGMMGFQLALFVTSMLSRQLTVLGLRR